MGSRTPSTPKPGTQAIRVKKSAPRDLNVRVAIGSGKSRVERSGRATLTDDTFRFRTGRTGDQGADFFIHLRYDEINVALDPSGASLTLTTRDGIEYKVHVGKHAPDWKEYMKPPPSRLTRLGITPGLRLSVLALPDEELADEIEAYLPGSNAIADSVGNLEAIFVGVEHKADLAQLRELAARLHKTGVLWVVYPTGARTLDVETITKAGAAAGLVRAGAVALSRAYEALRFRIATES